jgi:hypothetical protein
VTTAPIPFTNQQASSTDSLGGASPLALNIVSDQAIVRRRPGLRRHAGAPAEVVNDTGLAGVYVTLDGRLWAVAASGPERAIYKVSADGADMLGASVHLHGVRGTLRPTFAETESLLVIAGGAQLQKVELATDTSARLGGNPPLATHVVANASRLLANDATVDKTKVRYSDIAQGTVTYAGHEVWDNQNGDGGFVTAEARPDPVLAIGENTNEVFVWGSGTLQVFAPDPSVVYGNVVTEENGISAPYSALKVDQQFAWLDQARRVVMGNGRGQTILSTPIQLELNQLADVSDCHAFRFLQGPRDARCWRFPTDGRTYMFQKGAGWSQWSGPRRGRFPVNCLAVNPVTSEHVVGLDDGRIAELTFAAEDDLGEPIEAYVQTGYVDRGSTAKKVCNCVRLKLRRGTGDGADGPMGWLKWRDRPGPWTGEIPIDLGSSGDVDAVIEYRSLGVYRTREWLFQFDSPGTLQLISAVEDFEILEH